MSSTVEVIGYDPAWRDSFNAIVAVLRRHPRLAEVRIEHVGSTSVIGLAAKPIIDMDIIAESLEHVEQLKQALEALGYQHRGDLGIVGREAFFSPPEPTLPSHYLYLCNLDSLAFRNHLVLRDALRADKRLAKQYSELKKSLAKKYPNDIDRYCEAKSNFILSVLEDNGLSATDLETIGKQNTL